MEGLDADDVWIMRKLLKIDPVYKWYNKVSVAPILNCQLESDKHLIPGVPSTTKYQVSNIVLNKTLIFLPAVQRCQTPAMDQSSYENNFRKTLTKGLSQYLILFSLCTGSKVKRASCFDDPFGWL